MLTFTPGPSLTTTFGHTGLLIWDPSRGQQSWVYDHGHHDGQDPWFGVNYVLGKADYWSNRRTLSDTKTMYRRYGRHTFAQALNLTQEQVDLLEADQRTSLGQEHSFHYQWYEDNCTTRIRDALNEYATVRWPKPTADVAALVLGHTEKSWLGTVLRWGTGPHAHTALNANTAFLPSQLRADLSTATVDDQPLARPTCTLVPGTGAIPQPRHSQPWRSWGAVGVAAAILLGMSQLHSRLGRWMIVVFAVILTTIGLLDLTVGLTGSGRPWWTHHNQTVASPFSIALAFYALNPRRFRFIGWLSAAFAALGLGFALWHQGNAGTLLGPVLVLPGLITAHASVARREYNRVRSE